MKHLKNQQAMLEVLKTASPKLRKAILENCNDQVICILAEIILNLMKGHLKVHPSQKRQLSPFKVQLRRITRHCQKSHSINKRMMRKALIQSGGAFPFLIPLLAPLIAKAALGGVVAASTGAITKKIISG